MQDSHGHLISYLRISVTDRCNERCHYCLPEETQQWFSRPELLTWDELLRVSRVSSELGVHKIRITGGEPLTRRGLSTFIRNLRLISKIDSLGISTNGTLLSHTDPDFPGQTYAQTLVDAGVETFNISLDTLNAQRYQQITGRDYLNRVLNGLSALQSAMSAQHLSSGGKDQLSAIRLNCVISQQTSEEEILELTDFAQREHFLLRFIELMPISTVDVLHEHRFRSSMECKKILENSFGELLRRTDLKSNGPSQYHEFKSTGQIIGFISAMTNLHFCESCNKLRLTSDGKLRPCLGNHLEFDLRTALRTPNHTDEELKMMIRSTVARKPAAHDFHLQYQPQRRMIAIGG